MARATRQISLTDDELRRLLFSVRMAGQELHALRLDEEVAVFTAHAEQFGRKHVARSLIDKLLKAAE